MLNTRLVRPLSALLLLWVACAPGAVIAAANGAGADARLDSLGHKIASEQRLRLIVTLAPGQEPVLANPRAAFAANPALHQLRQDAVARLQQRLQQRLQSGALGDASRNRILKRFSNQPALVLDADSALFAQLRSDPAVSYIQEDHRLRPVLDLSVPRIGADITAANGFSGAGWAVAVLDSGVDGGHDFLAGKVIDEACFSSSQQSIDLYSLCPAGTDTQIGPGAGINCSGVNGCSHGTHVAGIAAGSNSTMTGVAPGAKVIAIQVFSELRNPSYCGSASCIVAFDSDIIADMEYVYNHRGNYPVAAVNLSLGGGLYASAASCDADNQQTKAVIDELRAVGIATVIASGNESASSQIASPGCISTAISVGATTATDTVANFSNSASWLSLLAPGTAINSSVPGNAFQSWSGTSMATPHVAGAFAVLRSAAAGASVDELLAALAGTGVPVTDARNGVTTGRIQLDAAVASLTAGPAPVTLVIDNQDGNTQRTGTWKTSTAAGAWNNQSLYATGSASFRWLPQLTAAHSYAVYAWWTYHKNRSTAVPYTIAHANGTSTVEVNQRDPALAGDWVLLGSYDFAGDGSGYVEVSGANGQACADAVRLVPVSGPVGANQPPQVAIVQPGSGAVYDEGDSVVLAGTASDSEDGDLAGAIAWQSSLDGDLGSGTPLALTTLSAGTHTITATVTDSAGATATAAIELAVRAAAGVTVELIVDNLDPGTSKSGNWPVSSAGGGWLGQSVYNGGGNTFRWPLTPADSGVYQVYAWWTYHANRSTAVPYYIHHAGVTDSTVVNQRDSSLGGKWVLLGSYSFAAGGGQYIEVSSENGQASADAVGLTRLQGTGNLAPVLAISSPAANSSFVAGDNITLGASASDVEDGNLSAGIEWSSNLDGPLGTGAGFATTLSAGLHVISAGITDSGGETASDAVTVIVNPAGAQEIIIDNKDSNTARTGSWSVSSSPGPWAGQSVYNNSGNTFRWLPQLGEPASYAVYAWWTYHANRSASVPWRINHAGGTSTVIENQKDPALAGRWVFLGVYAFSGNGSGYIEVSSENGQASADAVRLVRQ